MSTSRIPAFKAALATRLAADSDLTGVTITYGFPAAPTPDKDWVLLGNTRPEDTSDSDRYPGGQTSNALGHLTREERFVLEVIISVIRPIRETQQVTTERGFTIAGHIEDSIRAWLTETSPSFATATGCRWALVTALTHQEFVSTQSGEREARLFMDVAVSARI